MDIENSASPQNVHILDFSDEILLMIIKYLDESGSKSKSSVVTENIINLALVSTRFNNLLLDKSISQDMRIKWNVWVSRLSLVKYLRNGNQAQLVTILNLNDLYWIPSSVIRDLVVRLVNLKGFHAAGTRLGYKHLAEILTKLAGAGAGGIESLSWTWDKVIEESSSFGAGAADTDDPKSMEIRIPLSKLLNLYLTIPNSFNPLHLSRPFHSALTNFLSISNCPNLVRLWILSCPKTFMEIKYSMIPMAMAISTSEILYFPNLQEFIFSIPEPPKIYAPRLVSNVLNSLSKCPNLPRKVWIDHPLLHLHSRQPNSLNFHTSGWPSMDMSKLNMLSIPLFPEVLSSNHFNSSDSKKKPNLSSLKHLQITHGNQSIISLNGLFDSAINLESFISKAMNYSMDWNQFIKLHPKLSLVNVSQDTDISYPNFCVALSKLGNQLKRVSVPTFTLLEIKKCELIQEFRILAAGVKSLDDEGDLEPMPKKPDFLSYESNLFNKGRRIPRGASSSSSTSASSSQTEPYVCGLDFLTHGCPNVEEFEIGFTNQETRGRKLVLSSLSSIKLWKNLRKLTLDKTPISNGKFLIEIAQSCTLLESLKLTECGARAKCNYIRDLCKALTYCKHLKDFRLHQSYIGCTSYIFKALESCPKLQRLVIFSDSNDSRLESEPLINLMNTCPKLCVLYLSIGSTFKSTCDAIRIKLENLYKSTRPPLSIMIQIQNSRTEDNETFHYPAVHYREMVVFTSQVVIVPYLDFPDFTS